MVSLEFFIDIILPLHCCPGVDLSCNRNEYQEYILGGKGSWCVGLTTLPPSWANCLDSGSLNLLEPSGPVQACNGIALPLLKTMSHYLMLQLVRYNTSIKQFYAPKVIMSTVPLKFNFLTIMKVRL